MVRGQLVALFLSMLTLSLCPSGFGQCTGHVVLNDYERSAFLSAVFSTQEEVGAQFLAAEGCNKKVLDSLRSMGAKVHFLDEKVDYVLFALPRDRVLEALDVPGVAYALTAVLEPIRKDPAYAPPSERRAAPAPVIKIPYPRVAVTAAEDGPYFAAKEAGLTALWRDHPEADGRGVRVAVLDSGFDLLHPATQVAKDANGNIVPKVVDVVTLTSPDQDTNWVQFGDPLRATNGSFESAGRTWTVAQDGIYRFGIFSKQLLLGSELDADTRKLSLSVGVLWDEQTNRVWVDTDGDGSFRNQRALGDYAETHDVDCFGHKEGENDNRIPFGVKIDRARRAVYLSIPDGGHGAVVAGALAANRSTTGLFDGAAPNAQLIDVRPPTVYTTPSMFVPTVLTAFGLEGVDVVNRSGALGFPLNDGPYDFWRRVQERASAAYDKPIVCACVAAGALNAADYQSPEMLRRNRQLQPPYSEAMSVNPLFFASGLMNRVLAPSASLDIESRFMPLERPGKDGRRYYDGIIPAPPAPAGYSIAANPSPTIPVAAGILADLVSQAKRNHIRYSAHRLIDAVLTGARLVEGFPVSEQGFGLIDASRAWDQLAKMARADDPKNPSLTSFVVSRREHGHDEEVGGFQADLPQPAGKLRGELWITRRGGHSGGRIYLLSLRGNDGTYKLLNHIITLVRDKPARLQFEATVKPGLHSALLQLEDVKAAVIMQEVPIAVRAPDLAEVIAPGIEKYHATIPPRHLDYRFISLAKDVQAARFAMHIPYPGQGVTTAVRSMPGFRQQYGVQNGRQYPTLPASSEQVDAAHHVGPMEEIESLVRNDTPGVQEIGWENRGLPEYETPYTSAAPDVPITATLLVTKYAISFSKSDELRVRATNTLADIDGKVELFDANLISSDLTGTGSHAMVVLRRKLPPHLAQWRVHVSAPLGKSTVDAFLLDCTKHDRCLVTVQKAIREDSGLLVVDEPKEGDWLIAVRARNRIDYPVSYKIREASLVQALSSPQSNNEKHASGATWFVTVPPKQRDAQYIAFRIVGTPGKDDQKDGVRIAMKPFTSGAP